MIASLRHLFGWLVSAFRSREDLVQVIHFVAVRRFGEAQGSRFFSPRVAGGLLSLTASRKIAVGRPGKPCSFPQKHRPKPVRRRIAQNLLVAPLSAYLLVGTATGTSFLTIRGDAKSILARAAAVKQSGVNLIVLLALSDSGHAAYEAKHAEALASLGCPVFACTPDQFPSMMASALTGKDLQSWAAEEDIALIRGT